MEVYDDRPISFYDNLKTPANIHTSTPKSKIPATAEFITTTPTTTTILSPASPITARASSTPLVKATNGATCSPTYADIKFKFNDNNQPLQRTVVVPSQLFPNTDRNLHSSQLPVAHRAYRQVHPNPNAARLPTADSPTPHYTSIATPANVVALKTPTTTTTAITPITVTAKIPPTVTVQAQTTAAAAATTAAMNASRAQRPLSQHSQTELNEASQSIAAVKAALNDAKSKFFGLNGYAGSQDATTHQPQILQPLMDNQNHFPQVQIITAAPTTQLTPPAPKPQPKYQNIPENSAIFRNHQQQTTPPPELPPKPADKISPKMSAPLASPSTSSNAPTICAGQSPPPSASIAAQSQISPLTTYKQLPLNDIDTTQPSQAVYMSTTVPQNIKGSKIAGRHTPTRNSLRHSRMLVVNNKNFQGMEHPNPMNFKYPNLARWLLIAQLIFGFLTSFLAIWIFFLAPNTAVQDNPYWSGLASLIAGIFGLVLIRYQRIKRHKVREKCFLFLRAQSYLLSLLAVLLCCVALICASIHFARITASDTKCVSTNILLEHGSCTCTFNAIETPVRNSTADFANGLFDEEVVPEQNEDRSYKFEYRDLSCSEVKGAWTFVLGLSIVLNALGLLVGIIYIVMLVCCRHNSKRLYTSVHTSTF